MPITFKDREAFAHWLTGFVDGEGSFTINQNKKGDVSSSDCGILSVEFSIQLREDDVEILRKIQGYFGCGFVGGNSRKKARECGATNARDERTYKCVKIDDLVSKIILHFDEYPLRTRKAQDFEIWKQAALLQQESQRLRGKYAPIRLFPKCVEIRNEIVRLRDRLVSGRRSAVLSYPECLTDEGFGHWFSGLVDGEGCFGLYAYETGKEKISRRGRISFIFSVGLCEADRSVLGVCRDFLGGVTLRRQRRQGENRKDMMRLESKNLDVLLHNVIPHFSAYPLRSKKAAEIALWAEAVFLQKKCFELRGGKYNSICKLSPANRVLCDDIRRQISDLGRELQKDRNPSLRRSKKVWSA